MATVTLGRNSLCEKKLKKDEFNQLSDFIYEELKIDMDSQIFIENSIVETLEKNDLLRRQNYLKGFHYGYHDDMFGGEEPFDFTDEKGKIFLVRNCTGYMQVSYFQRKDVKYTHYLQGMKKIIVIHEDNIEE